MLTKSHGTERSTHNKNTRKKQQKYEADCHIMRLFTLYGSFWTNKISLLLLNAVNGCPIPSQATALSCHIICLNIWLLLSLLVVLCPSLNDLTGRKMHLSGKINAF